MEAKDSAKSKVQNFFLDTKAVVSHKQVVSHQPPPDLDSLVFPEKNKVAYSMCRCVDKSLKVRKWNCPENSQGPLGCASQDLNPDLLHVNQASSLHHGYSAWVRGHFTLWYTYKLWHEVNSAIHSKQVAQNMHTTNHSHIPHDSNKLWHLCLCVFSLAILRSLC